MMGAQLNQGHWGARRVRGPARYPDMPWEPKAAFDALADLFGADDRTDAAKERRRL